MPARDALVLGVPSEAGAGHSIGESAAAGRSVSAGSVATSAFAGAGGDAGSGGTTGGRADGGLSVSHPTPATVTAMTSPPTLQPKTLAK